MEKVKRNERESQLSEVYFAHKVRGFVSPGLRIEKGKSERESKRISFSQLKLIFYANKNVNCGCVRFYPLEMWMNVNANKSNYMRQMYENAGARCGV